MVDLLGDSAGQQANRLGARDGLTGAAWGAHAAAPVAAQETPVTTLARLFTIETEKEAPIAVSSPADARLPDQSIANRLQTLQGLFDRKLITEEEYKQQKQRILNEL